MIAALLIGRRGSRGLPGKNWHPVLGRPLMEYPVLAAKASAYIERFFLSTDAEEIRSIGLRHGFECLDRPRHLASDEALVETVVADTMRRIEEVSGKRLEICVLLFCNSATIKPGVLDEGIEALRRNADLDSAVTVSRYNQYSPARAKKVGADGLLRPFVGLEHIPGVSSDRDSQGDCYFCDCSAWILGRRCMDLEGPLPFRWIGRRSLPLFQEGGLDVDYEQDLVTTEFWLRRHGFTEHTTPYATSGTGAARR